MPRGKQDGGKSARGGDRGGKWEGGGGGLSRKQKDAVDALVAAQEKEDKRKEEKRIRRIARQEARRTSSSDSDFEYQHKRKESKHNEKKHSKHHPSSATSSSEHSTTRRIFPTRNYLKSQKSIHEAFAAWGLHIVLPGYTTSSNVLRRPTAFRRSNPHENRTRTRPSTPRQRLQVPWLSSRLGSPILGPAPQMPDRNLAWCVLPGGNFIWRCPSRECLAQATPLNPRLPNPLASRLLTHP